jgi:hypothetical protein
VTEHAPGCGANCQCGYDSPPCRTCNCGAAVDEQTRRVIAEQIERWKPTLDWLAER